MSVLTRKILELRSLVAGLPAKGIRPLNQDDLVRLHGNTRGHVVDERS
jgi:carbonic anhydrase/acetyltransferase-like protein (isoleucine patch superfamily)